MSNPTDKSWPRGFLCGATAALAGAFVTWSRPQSVPQMLARWGKGTKLRVDS